MHKVPKTALAALMSLSVLSPRGLAQPPQSPAGPEVHGTGAELLSRVLFDEPGDGSLWAHGATWKMSFEAGAATYYPFLGSAAPRNFPIRFALRSASQGGEVLDLGVSEAAYVDGDRVVIDHGSLREIYRVEPREVEQLFLMERPAGQGELVIELDVDTELARFESLQHLEYTSEFGGVSYSRAIAIDAEGARKQLTTSLIPGGIRITAPQDFIAEAAWPLLIDPVITTVDVPADAVLDAEDPEVAWSEGSGVYIVTWERPFSGSDIDLFTEFVDGSSGQLIPDSLRIVDVSDECWTNSSVAQVEEGDDFLVAAERGDEGSTAIWGRVRSANTNFSGPQFQISDLSGYEINPVVGGNSGSSSERFLVAWERVRTSSGTDRDIFGQLVEDGSLAGSQIVINSTINTEDRNPAISKSRRGSAWTVVWQRNQSTNNADILGARINASGNVFVPTFEIDGFQTNTDFPVVSSPIESGHWIVAYRAFVSGNYEIFCRVYQDNSTSPIEALTVTFNDGSPDSSKTRPYIDASDSRFMITYSEAQSAFDSDAFATTLFLDLSGDLRIAEGYVELGGGGIVATPAPVTATSFDSGTGQRFLAVWDQSSLFSSDNDVRGALFEPEGPVNDMCLDAIQLVGTGIFPFTTEDANTDGETGACGVAGQVWNDVWFRWTPPGAGLYSVSTCDGTSLDTVIAIYPGADCPSDDPLVCANNSCGLQSQATFVAAGGNPLFIRLGANLSVSEGSGSLRIQLVSDDMLGENYCLAAPNSVSPSGARMGALGSTSVSANDLTVEATDLPPGVPGLFFFGPNPVQIPFGDGFRCVGGAIRRLNPAQTVSGLGRASLALDNNQFPASNLTVGTTALFQFWYRDPMGGPFGFNLTDGLALTFVP